MSHKAIHIIPDPVLRKKAKALQKVDAEAGKFMDVMLESMYVGRGIGLAANQVGVLDRVITVDISEERNGTKALLMANPEITWREPEETFIYNEGCLSIPEQFADVARPRRIRVRYLDQTGKIKEIEAEDLLSQCIQHEIDHLNGVLFIDHLSRLKKSMIERKVEKAQRQKDEHLL